MPSEQTGIVVGSIFAPEEQHVYSPPGADDWRSVRSAMFTFVAEVTSGIRRRRSSPAPSILN